MSKTADGTLDHGAASPLARLFGRPKIIAVGCVVALTVLGWIYLAVLIAQTPPGGIAADLLPRIVNALCRPGGGHPGMPAGPWTAADFVIVWLMWCAMALAMMLPSAGPMIYTYAEIAEAAARKREPVVSPFVLAGGYVVVWFGFSIAAALAQGALARSDVLDGAMASASGLFSGALFAAAGFYQFSALKHACLTQCQRPFPFFFTHWETTRRGVFRLGLRQGLYCLGCCWAMMLLMLVTGAMNILWMAALGIVMTVEKMTTTLRFTKAIGVAMIAAGAVMIAVSVAAHWPGRP